MKLTLKKSTLVNLSEDTTALPAELTPQVAGGNYYASGQPDCVQTETCFISFRPGEPNCIIDIGS